MVVVVFVFFFDNFRKREAVAKTPPSYRDWLRLVWYRLALMLLSDWSLSNGGVQRSSSSFFLGWRGMPPKNKSFAYSLVIKPEVVLREGVGGVPCICGVGGSGWLERFVAGISLVACAGDRSPDSLGVMTSGPEGREGGDMVTVRLSFFCLFLKKSPPPELLRFFYILLFCYVPVWYSLIVSVVPVACSVHGCNVRTVLWGACSVAWFSCAVRMLACHGCRFGLLVWAGQASVICRSDVLFLWCFVLCCFSFWFFSHLKTIILGFDMWCRRHRRSNLTQARRMIEGTLWYKKKKKRKNEWMNKNILFSLIDCLLWCCCPCSARQ